MKPHPLDQLSVQETNRVRDLVLALYPQSVLSFRETYLQEPSKKLLKEYLVAEHNGKNAPRPPRQALAQYDVIGEDHIPQFHESVIDLDQGKQVSHVIVSKEQHAALTL